MVRIYKYDLNDGLQTVVYDLHNKNIDLPLTNITIEEDDKTGTIRLAHNYNAAYGMGERFNRVNQKNLSVRVEVIEKFCNQGSISYCPIPFFFTDNNLGVFIDTYTVTEYHFEEEIKINFKRDSKNRMPIVYFLKGAPRDLITAYSELTGKPSVIPKWSFGPWMSANRWNTQEEAIKQMELSEKYNFPFTVMVLEAWSDEATFYRFNDHGEWNDAGEFIKLLSDQGIHLILWQIPVWKKCKNGELNDIHAEDWNYAIEHNLCIKKLDGTPYTIPENKWFAGSLLPDFSNPDTVKWWFGKRQYLLDMGVSGFKTDGGEFILTDDVVGYEGLTGLEMRNQYVAKYIEEYSRFIGRDRVLFSRAGYTGQQKFPIHWAGDQVSTWEEFRHDFIAGLSIGLSGIPFWGFDIAGFSGSMPSLELYERATQLAVFAPIMQWHSEPIGGQFSNLESIDQFNERSPWNISRKYGDLDLIERLRYYYNLRMNLLPYLFNLALQSVDTGLPMMKHLILEYPKDENVYDIEDSFMLGDILIAPFLSEGQSERMIYLPDGMWNGLWPMEVKEPDGEALASAAEGLDKSIRLKGGRKYLIKCGKDRIPAFIRDGGCLALNLNDTLKLGSCVGNQTMDYANLCFYTAGENGEYHFKDDAGNEISLYWKDGIPKAEQPSGNVKFKILNKI